MGLPIDTPHITQNLEMPIRQANSDILLYLHSYGIEYHQRGVDQDTLSTYTSFDDYGTMFEARHGRGAMDNMTITSEKVSITSSIMVPTPATSRGVTENLMTETVSKHTPRLNAHFLVSKVKLLWRKSIIPPVGHDVVPPVGVGHILGEGAAIFTDMTKTILVALDKHTALPDTVQKSVSSSLNNFLASGPTSHQSEIRQDVPNINAS